MVVASKSVTVKVLKARDTNPERVAPAVNTNAETIPRRFKIIEG